jgi:transposase
MRVLCCEAAGDMMARAYSQDLRDRVIEAGTSARAAAERFGIGVATAIVWVRRAREGERSARKQGQPRRSKLDLHRDYLLGLIAAEPDITIVEIQERLRSEAGVSASVGTIWTFLDRAGLTFKKRPPTRPSRTARTSCNDGRPGSTASSISTRSG